LKEINMAKQEEKKKRTKKKAAPLGKVGRLEREKRMNRIITYSTVIVVAAIVIIVAVGAILEEMVYPSQPIAVVNGEEILTKEYQARVKFERNSLVNQYLQYYQILQFITDQFTQAQYVSQMRQLLFQLDPSTIGHTTLNTMIDEVLIRQKAEEMGIDVTETEIDTAMQEFFGYYPDGRPTPTITPTLVATSTWSALQTSLATIPPTPTDTQTPTIDPTLGLETPTMTATFAPTLTPTPYTFDSYQEDLQSGIDYLTSEFGFTEEFFRNYVAAQLYREKLSEALTADLPREQDQVWARHILVDSAETAQEVIDRLDAGEDFGALALEYSLDTTTAENGGDLGWFSVTRMVPEFARVAFNIEVGEISEPVQSQFGWHIIQVLGHEMRPLSPSEYNNFRFEEFNTWLSEENATADITIMDFLESRIPDEPAVPPQAIIQ
jgi:parvulin-like peptidyl-prolyl isomerase